MREVSLLANGFVFMCVDARDGLTSKRVDRFARLREEVQGMNPRQCWALAPLVWHTMYVH